MTASVSPPPSPISNIYFSSLSQERLIKLTGDTILHSVELNNNWHNSPAISIKLHILLNYQIFKTFFPASCEIFIAKQAILKNVQRLSSKKKNQQHITGLAEKRSDCSATKKSLLLPNNNINIEPTYICNETFLKDYCCRF